jgi:hypothetical protein
LIVLAFAKTPTEAKGEKKCRRRSVSSRQIRRHHLSGETVAEHLIYSALDFIEEKEPGKTRWKPFTWPSATSSPWLKSRGWCELPGAR